MKAGDAVKQILFEPIHESKQEHCDKESAIDSRQCPPPPR